MLIISTQKKERINEFSLWFISILCIGVSAITLFMIGFIVDEYNLSGDPQSFCMFIAIGGGWGGWYLYKKQSNQNDKGIPK